jgi:glycosyltransferase involved in cell wall biosynthesis
VPARPRILLVEEASETGGAVMSLESLLPDGPADSRYDFSVALGGSGGARERLIARGADVHVVPVQGWRWFEKFRPSLAGSLPLQAASLARWRRFLRRMAPAVVHLNNNRLIDPLIAARSLRLPVVVHFRDIPSHSTTPFLAGARAYYAMMNRASMWIANSSATEADIRPHARVPVVAIPNGLDIAAFDRRAADARAEAPHSGAHVAMVALINKWKRYEDFIDVAEAVLRRQPDVRFSIAGSGSESYVRELRARADAKGLTRALFFTGHVDNVPAFLRTVDILVHTTNPEPFGRVFLEAMAARRPAVAFRSGGAAEIVVDNETGLLVPPSDNALMADAILKLLADPDMRARFGDAGRRRVETCYSTERYRASVMAQYETLLA